MFTNLVRRLFYNKKDCQVEARLSSIECDLARLRKLEYDIARLTHIEYGVSRLYREYNSIQKWRLEMSQAQEAMIAAIANLKSRMDAYTTTVGERVAAAVAAARSAQTAADDEAFAKAAADLDSLGASLIDNAPVAPVSAVPVEAVASPVVEPDPVVEAPAVAAPVVEPDPVVEAPAEAAPASDETTQTN